MRAALTLLFLTGVAAADVTHTLSDSAISTLTGCWRVHGEKETWTFRANGNHGLEVVRELGRDAVEAARARLPRPVMFSPEDHDFAFAAAGRIHGLMVIFTIDHAVLRASYFSSHDGKSYFSTGNNVVAERCERAG